MADLSLMDVAGQLVPSLVVILGALLLVKRFARKGGFGAARTDLRVVARTGLTKNASVAIVEVAGRRFLVGATDQRVELLSEIDGDGDLSEATERLLAATGTDGRAEPSSVTDLVKFRAASDAALPTPADTNGPRIGLVERLQLMTLRSPARARPPWRPDRDGQR